MKEFYDWLNGVTCTAPFTLDDAKALKRMIKQQVPKAVVDVYWTRGSQVFLRIASGDKVIEREYDVV